MTITLNGERSEIAERAAVTDLVATLGLKPERIAVEINGQIIRRSAWGSTSLVEGDKVEIVHFVGGGAQ